MSIGRVRKRISEEENETSKERGKENGGGGGGREHQRKEEREEGRKRREMRNRNPKPWLPLVQNGFLGRASAESVYVNFPCCVIQPLCHPEEQLRGERCLCMLYKL